MKPLNHPKRKGRDDFPFLDEPQQINSDDYHPEAKYAVNLWKSPYSAVQGYGHTPEEATADALKNAPPAVRRHFVRDT